MKVRVQYLFAIRDRDAEQTQTVEVAAGATVFDVLRLLGLSGLELLLAINGEAVADSTVLHDRDELVLIPAIQGG